MGSRGRVLPAPSWAVTQGSLGKLGEKDAAAPAGAREMASCEVPPRASGRPLCPPRKGHAARFAFQPTCLLAALHHSRSPPSRGSLVAFILFCFLCVTVCAAV